jgi:hypothetical protein
MMGLRKIRITFPESFQGTVGQKIRVILSFYVKHFVELMLIHMVDCAEEPIS